MLRKYSNIYQLYFVHILYVVYGGRTWRKRRYFIFGDGRVRTDFFPSPVARNENIFIIIEGRPLIELLQVPYAVVAIP